MSIRRPTALVLVASGALGLLIGPDAGPAGACSCIATTDAEAFEQSDAVFVGEVIGYEPPPAAEVMSSLDPATWTFGVSEVFKGEVTAVQEIVSAVSGASCGLEIPRQGEFLVFATRDGFDTAVAEGQYHSGLCSGTRSTDGGPLGLDIASSPPLRPATAGPSGPAGGDAGVGGADDASAPVALWAAVAAAAVVALAAGLALRRRARTP